MKTIRIGIDIDNTLINYKSAYRVIYGKNNKKLYFNGRNYVKEKIKKSDPTGIKWRHFQSELYTSGLSLAKPSKSIITLLKMFNRLKNFKVFLISHKTLKAEFDKSETDLRDICEKWLINNNIVSNYISETNVFYTDTQIAKIEKINELRLDFFIDDLDEILLSRKINYSTKMLKFRIESNFIFTILNFLNIVAKIQFQRINFKKFLKILNSRFFDQVYSRGANSVIYRINVDNYYLVAKWYVTGIDNLVSFNQEYNNLILFHNISVRNFPKILFKSRLFKFVVLEFIDGRHPILDEKFVLELISISNKMKTFYSSNNQISEQSQARDSTYYTHDLLNQAETRFKNLLDLATKKENRSYIEDRILQVKKLKDSSINFELNQRTLLLADVGPHNALVTASGDYVFIDLEFAGVDSPYKFIAETVLHPKNSWKYNTLEIFLKKSISMYDIDIALLTQVFLFCSYKWQSIIMRRLIDDNSNIDLSENFSEFQTLQSLLNTLKMNNVYHSGELINSIMKSFGERVNYVNA